MTALNRYHSPTVICSVRSPQSPQSLADPRKMEVRLTLALAEAAHLCADEQSSEIVFEQHRVYVLRDFARLPNGDIVCSGYAPSHPDIIISARFRSVTIISSWQDSADPSRFRWRFEIISFRAARLNGKRFRFRLICIDF